MNTRKNEGITLLTLVITIILLIIISGISITGTIKGQKQTNESTQITELNMVQHAILERYTKSQLTKETLPGTTIEKQELQTIIEEIKTKTGEQITLKGNETEYKQLNKTDLKNLGITQEEDIYIVNYKTGEVINKTQKVTTSGKALYIYSKKE